MPTNFNQSIKDAAKTKAIAGSPREVCGIVYSNSSTSTQHIIFIDNISEEPTQYFLFDPVTLANELDTIDDNSNLTLDGYFHSHVTETETPSLQDQMMINKLNKDMLIYSVYTDNFHVAEPNSDVYPLVGRQFNYVTANCYTVVQDYYKEIRNIILNEYTNMPNWWKKGDNLFVEYAEAAGFETVNTLQQHDIILMQIESSVPNHVAVYLNNNTMLHHPLDRLSQKTIYGGYWQKLTRNFYRYNP